MNSQYFFPLCALPFLVACGGMDPPQAPRNIPASAACQTIDEGRTRCVGDTVQICQSRTWKPATRCAEMDMVCRQVGDLGATCVLGDTNNNAGALDPVCEQAEEVIATCFDMAVPASNDTVACTGKTRALAQCVVDHAIDACAYFLDPFDAGPNAYVDCADDVEQQTDWGDDWDDEDDWDEPQPGPEPGTNPEQCADGAFRCANNRHEQCYSGTWLVYDDCEYYSETCVDDAMGVRCVVGGPTPAPACTEGHQRCQFDTRQTCSGGQWITTENCGASGEVCEEQSAWSATCVFAGGGVCDGLGDFVCGGDNAVYYCGNGTPELYLNCNNIAGYSGYCYNFGGDWGGDCVMASGEACLFDQGGEPLALTCGGAGGPSSTMACDFVDGCVATASSSTCTSAMTPHCLDGIRLAFDCLVLGTAPGQKVTYNCTFLDGVCANNRCELPEGADCDPNNDLAVCSPGFTCTLGTCQPFF